MTALDLAATAKAIVAPGKGILAADESTNTIQKRFDGINVNSTETSRRDYRELLITTAGAEEHVGGIILFDETLRQNSAGGEAFVTLLNDLGIAPGIKVDKGLSDLAGAPGEKVTEGLDGLRPRLIEYAELGAAFAKWRAVITIGENIPSSQCIEANASALARYAALCQEAGLVPIVEPEVLMAGDHSIEACEEVTDAILRQLYSQMAVHGVQLEGSLLKPNMVTAGDACADQASVETVAEMTLRTLRRCVPAAVPGIVFLSGGQSEQAATAHLNAMNAMGPHPWEVSFSYGRALQQSALKTWAGKADNVAAAQAAYLHRARMNGLARYGEYRAELEQVG